MSMMYITKGQSFEVKQTGNRFFYYSKRAFRWLPVAKSKVTYVIENSTVQ